MSAMKVFRGGFVSCGKNILSLGQINWKGDGNGWLLIRYFDVESGGEYRLRWGYGTRRILRGSSSTVPF